MEGSERAYEQLLRRLENELPDLALQVRAEVARGRTVSGSRIPPEDRQAREEHLERAGFGRIGKTDVAGERTRPTKDWNYCLKRSTPWPCR